MFSVFPLHPPPQIKSRLFLKYLSCWYENCSFQYTSFPSTKYLKYFRISIPDFDLKTKG